MSVTILSDDFTAAGQIMPSDVAALKRNGYTAILCLRPDDEDPEQPTAAEIAQAAEEQGLNFGMFPIPSGRAPDVATLKRLQHLIADIKAIRPEGRIFAYCRSGGRVRVAYELLKALPAPISPQTQSIDIVIVGGGAGGIATAASLLKRDANLKIAVVEPASDHYYQPAWTLVGGGAYDARATRRSESSVMPKGVIWIQQPVVSFRPEQDRVVLADGSELAYKALVVATGLSLNFDAIPGLAETLGQNGVTSNYRYDLAPYTWELVRKLEKGTAIFTQPPPPFKCAGAPQKAVYLSCDNWMKRQVRKNISVEFDLAGGALFGVKEFIPVLMSYIRRYRVELQLHSKLIAVDGKAKQATFERKVGDEIEIVTRQFDILHVVPPQSAPKEVRESALANNEGFIAVDPATLQHFKFKNVFAVGDVAGTSNAKTMAAARKQAPIVAQNLISFLSHQPLDMQYDGYGGCPLTVEKGKIVLAEFGYGGNLMPSFPKWLIRATAPSRAAWILKKYILPQIYWHGMLKGREIALGLKRRQS